MTRAEILSDIKRAEEEARNMAIQANEARIKKINETKSQAREILKSVEEESGKDYMTELTKAREESMREKEKIIRNGLKEAEDIKSKARNNISKAAKFILNEFERASNA